jgi:hypothetical protein
VRLATVVAAYAAVTLVFFWPLPLYLTTKFPGPITDDTAVYVWNLWHFRHQILGNKLPYFTDVVLSLSPGSTDLSLHNYTTFANALAFPLIPVFGLTATFNIVCMLLVVLTATCTYLLAMRVVKRAPEAWLAGAAFAFSPVLTTRSTGHFSLVAAAPLPVFILCLLNAGRTRNLWWGWAAGAAMAWSVLCDPYYGIVCLLAGGAFLCVEWIRVLPGSVTRSSRLVPAIDLLAVSIAGFVAFIVFTGGVRFVLLGNQVGLQSLYTPVLVFVCLMLARAWLLWRPRATFSIRFQPWCVSRFTLTTGVMCALLLSPMLYALSYRLADGGSLHAPIYWRSSTDGIDLLALFTPNPNHPIFGAPWRRWLSSMSGDYLETVSTLPVVAIAIIVGTMWRLRFRPPVLWVALLLLFAALALGPFVHVGGINTYVPGPWALLRYVPVVSAARVPGRFAIPAMLAFAMLFGTALRHACNRLPEYRRPILAAVGTILLFELLPAPRTLYSAEVPAVYKIIAADSRDVRVLNLPFGFRDGESSVGNFNPAAQYYQTYHGKRLIGAYLSRISRNEIGRQRKSFITLRALIALSEGKSLPPEVLRVHKWRGPRFVRRANLGYVVISTHASSELREFAIEAFGLEKISESDGLELFRPSSTAQQTGNRLTLAELQPIDEPPH